MGFFKLKWLTVVGFFTFVAELSKFYILVFTVLPRQPQFCPQSSVCVHVLNHKPWYDPVFFTALRVCVYQRVISWPTRPPSPLPFAQFTQGSAQAPPTLRQRGLEELRSMNGEFLKRDADRNRPCSHKHRRCDVRHTVTVGTANFICWPTFNH